jgi:MFS family permease
VELSWLLIFKIVAFLIAIPIVIGLFSEVPWLIRLRLIASLLTGIVLIGLLGWPLAAPSEPFGVVSVVTGSITVGDALALTALAFVTGLLAYFICWPLGSQVGPLAVPAGLAVWALCSGNMAELIRHNPALEQRQALFAAIRWEPLFWLVVVAAGLAGVLLGQRIQSSPKTEQSHEQKPDSKANIYLNAILALVASVLIGHFCIRVLARDVSVGSVVAQPETPQIAFAVSLSFGIAAFVVKKFLDAGYVFVIIASALVTGFTISAYVKTNALQNLVEHWPAVFFSNAVVSISPVQMVAFGTLGSIAGYWLAMRYTYWRKDA